MIKHLRFLKDEKGGHTVELLKNAKCRGVTQYARTCTSLLDFEYNGNEYKYTLVHGFAMFDRPTSIENQFVLNPLGTIKDEYFDALKEEAQRYIPEETEMEIITLLDQR